MSHAPPAPAFSDPYAQAQPEFVNAPYPSKVEYDKGWWFNYFWAEARTQHARITALRSVYRQAFQPDPIPTLQNATAIQSGQVKLVPKDLTDAEMKQVLERLLLIGFKAMELTPHYIVDASTVLANEVRVGMMRLAKIENVRFAYRGEQRDVETLCKHAANDSIATKSKVIALGMNSNQPWHPFSDPYFRNRHYFRLGAVDNCLHSVISITDQFYVATKFPLLNDANIYPMPADVRRYIQDGGVATGPINNQDWWQTRKAKVFLGHFTKSGKAVPMFWTENTLYIFKFRDADTVFSTQAYQKALSDQNFPEQAVAQIPLDNYLAAIRLRRVHHGMDHTAQGHTAFVQDVKIIGTKPIDLGEDGTRVLIRKLDVDGGRAMADALKRIKDTRRFVVGKNENISDVITWDAPQPTAASVKIR